MPFDQYNESSDGDVLVAYANGDPHAARILTERLMPRAFSLNQFFGLAHFKFPQVSFFSIMFLQGVIGDLYFLKNGCGKFADLVRSPGH